MSTIKINEEVKRIIEVLTTKFTIEEIYLNTYNRENLPNELIILVSNKYVKTLGDLVPRITNSIRDYPTYRVSCYIAFQAKDKIREGNLFLFTSCVSDKLIYKREGSEFAIIPDTFNFDKFAKKVYALRNKEFQKVEEFKDGYFFYKEKGQYSMASFMMHQAIELTYRYLEVLLSAKERIKHSIRGHHHYLKEINTMYVSVFDDENDTDQYLLNVLEDIYRATRYEDNFDISLETLVLLEDKMKLLSENAINIYEGAISSFESGITTDGKGVDANNDKNCLPIDLSKSDLDGKIASVVEELKSLFPEDISVYLFGYRAERFEMESLCENKSTGIYHLDFLIVSCNDMSDLVNSVQATLNESSDLSLLLLSHQVDNIQKKLDENNPFFHRVLENKAPVFDTLKINWLFHEGKGLSTSDEEEIVKSNWYEREDNSSGFFNGGKAIDNSEEVSIKVLLFNQAIEQACLGLLEYFLGYTPRQYNLNHLYGLCSSFWSFPTDIFPQSTKEERKIFKDLVKTVKDTRYKGWSSVGWDEAYRYQNRCERFLEECSKLVRGE